jgi:hypothetical protein
LGEIIGILRRTIAIQDFSVLLSLDLRTPLSVTEVIDIIQNNKSTIDSQIKEIHQEISDAESLSILRAGDKEVLNEEGLPIKDIREEVFDEDEGTRAVLAEEVPSRVYTMEEIDKMMDEAEEEERAELEASQKKPASVREDGMQEDVTAVAGQGLDVGQVSGEELIAKLVDDSKNRYNPIDGTWVENDEEESTDGEYETEEEEEEEEDEYGRTRGFLIPPHLYRGTPPKKGVKFASFEKPATPSIGPPEKTAKSALKNSNPPPPVTSTPSSAVPARAASVMSTNVVERAPKKEVCHHFLILIVGYPKPRYQGNSQNKSFQSS